MQRRSLVSLLLAASMTLAACGSDADEATETVTDAADEAADTAEETAEETEDTAEEAADDAEETADDMADDMDGEMDMTDWPESLVFTLTPSAEQGGLIETAEPLAEMLSAELGGIEVEPLVPSDYAGVIVALESGQAQIAGGLGPRQMIQAEEQAGAELILQAERFGSLLYVTQWFTNDPDTFCDDEPVANEDGYLFCNGVLDADDDYTSGPIGADKLALLEGQTVAFVDAGSTSGYAIPALQLVDAGVDPIDGIDALLAGGHDASVQAVYDGDAVAGVSYNDARDLIAETSPDVGEQLVVFGWSGPIPNDGVAVAGDLPESLVTAITDAFVTISGTEEGAALLSELYSIDAFVPVTSSDYDVIRDLEAQLGDVLE